MVVRSQLRLAMSFKTKLYDTILVIWVLIVLLIIIPVTLIVGYYAVLLWFVVGVAYRAYMWSKGKYRRRPN